MLVGRDVRTTGCDRLAEVLGAQASPLILAFSFWPHPQPTRNRGRGARITFGSRLPRTALASFFLFYREEQFSPLRLAVWV